MFTWTGIDLNYIFQQYQNRKKQQINSKQTKKIK